MHGIRTITNQRTNGGKELKLSRAGDLEGAGGKCIGLKIIVLDYS